MKTFKELRNQIEESSWTATKKLGSEILQKIQKAGEKTPNLPARIEPQVPKTSSNLPARIEPAKPPVPVQKRVPEVKKAEQEYIPATKRQDVAVPKQRTGKTYEQKPETKTRLSPKTVAKATAVTAAATAIKSSTQTQPKRKLVSPTAPVTTDVGSGKPSGKGPGIGGPSGGGGKPGGGGKSPFTSTPFGDGGSGKPSGEVDPNIGGGFVTAGVSKGPKGELMTKNLQRGAADKPGMSKSPTDLTTPIKKVPGETYATPSTWQTPTKGLPPQGTVARDDMLAKSGYKKF
jgi:hypothetical protein